MCSWSRLRESDIPDLENFFCADPPSLTPVGEIDPNQPMHAIDVQTYIQSEINWPLDRGDHVLIGRDEQGIAAIAHWHELGGPFRVKILAIARELRLKGARVGDELIDELTNELLAETEGRGARPVLGYCDVAWANQSCQQLLAAHHFWHGPASGVAMHDEWYVLLNPVDDS